MREIEVKIKIDNLKAVEEKLKHLGCVLSSPVRQHDTIYVEEGTIFEVNAKKDHRVVRLRREDHRAIFNIKQQKSNELDSLEEETDVSDPDSMHKILLALGFKPEVEVRKVRRHGRIAGYEICLDEVEKLGSFVELEKMTEDNVDPKEVQAELLVFLESLGLPRANQETRGYDTQVYQLGRKNSKAL